MNNNSLKQNINTIRETAPGRFRIILDFATTGIVKFLLHDDYKYVWVNNHMSVAYSEWKNFELPILPNMENKKVLAKGVQYDFIIETDKFKELLLNWNGGIEMIQMNKIPPYYLDLVKIKGNKRYELLSNECDFLFELEIPSATDYGTLISNNRDYLQSLLDNPDIDWKNLP